MRRDPEILARDRAALAHTARQRRRLLVERVRGGGAVGARVVVDGRELVDFCSNDYLGLARHPEVIAALAPAAAEFGAGSGAAHLVSGHAAPHQALEEELAGFTGRERALLFSTGYMANLGVISTFAGRGEVVLADRLNHASLLDGARLSGARLLRYAHADAVAAGQLLAQRNDVALLATDGVFSMDGDIAPLGELASRAATAHAWLLVDDAHGLGVLARGGGGTLALAGLDAAAVPLLVGTLGKAIGTFGAFVAGDADTIEYLLQHARTYLYTTALPPAVAAATRVALRLARAEEWRRERLQALIARFRAAAARAGLEPGGGSTPIQPLIVGTDAQAVRWSALLRAAGFWVVAIRPPTVPEGSARLRITLSALHREADVDALVAALAEARATCGAEH
ncbi:MAG: 8-amino-7-oxononanoate synthase [Gammaproteobacteria bacterium]|nr:8-amino-7-oxononanoate synthase [Gammaproteobacteria bacterium]